MLVLLYVYCVCMYSTWHIYTTFYGSVPVSILHVLQVSMFSQGTRGDREFVCNEDLEERLHSGEG